MSPVSNVALVHELVNEDQYLISYPIADLVLWSDSPLVRRKLSIWPGIWINGRSWRMEIKLQKVVDRQLQ